MSLSEVIILDVVTPERAVVRDLEVTSVILPGKSGRMNTLAAHANLLTELKPGTFAYLQKGHSEMQWASLSGGYAQVNGEKLTVLAETLELDSEIDKARAELAIKNAEARLAKPEAEDNNHTRARRNLNRAQARLEALQKK